MNNKINEANHKFESEQAIYNIRNKIHFDTYGIIEKEDEKFYLYLNRNLYFITIQLSLNFTSDFYTLKRQQMTLEAIDGFYKWMSSRFIKRSQGRNSKYQPFLQLFLDNENSRYCDLKGPISAAHFHGLLLFHPKTVVCFERFLRESSPMNLFPTEVALRTPAFYPIETVTFSRFDPETGPIDNLISYTTKFARNQRFVSGDDEGIKLLTIHPQISSKLYPFYKSKGCKIWGNYIY